MDTSAFGLHSARGALHERLHIAWEWREQLAGQEPVLRNRAGTQWEGRLLLPPGNRRESGRILTISRLLPVPLLRLMTWQLGFSWHISPK